MKAVVLAMGLVACAPIHRLAHPHTRTPDWALEGDFSLVCVAGAATAVEYNAGNPGLFLASLGAFLGLIALDTWAAR